MIRRAGEALANAPLWVLRVLFGTTAFLVGFGIFGVTLGLGYDPDADAEVTVHNETSDVVQVRWDLMEPVDVQVGAEARFDGGVSQHVIRLSSIGDHNLTVEYSFDALSSGSELNIAVAPSPSEVGEVP